MKTNSLKTFLYISLILAFALALTACEEISWAESKEDVLTKSFNVSEGGKLNMDVDRGSIEIDTKKGDTVKVKVIMKARAATEEKAQRIFEDYKVDFKHSGSDVTIDAEWEGSKGFLSRGNKLQVRFFVTVPEKYDLDLRTAGGSISVNEIEGEVKVKTSGGSLEFDTVKGSVWGRTAGGSIKLEGCTGDADVDTSGGSISIGKVEGEVKAHTAGGSIAVKEVMGTINATTSGGSVTAYISRQPKGDCSLKTSGGSVTARLAKDIKVDLDAKTSSGKVYTDFPVTTKGEKSKRKLNAKINGGGPELYIRTSGGNIEIKEIN